jgi:hypothetical protein
MIFRSSTRIRSNRRPRPVLTCSHQSLRRSASRALSRAAAAFTRSRRADPRAAVSPAELGRLVSIPRSAGTDLFHVSTRRFWTPEWLGSDLGLAGWVKSGASASTSTS